jgi:hypothetical protein
MHVLPQLRELEQMFAEELVVIGVHSGKFRAERETGNIAQAARRLGVAHAIVNDRQYRTWRAFSVGAWPTIVLIDPAGGYVGTLPGEFEAAQLVPLIRGIIDEFDRADAPRGARLQRGRFPLRVPVESDTLLRFPGKVLGLAVPGRESSDGAGGPATPDGGARRAGAATRLFVADTGRHRILELQVELEGWRHGVAGERPRARVVRTIGSGARGRADGPLAQATFDRPLGMALGHRPEPWGPLAGTAPGTDAAPHARMESGAYATTREFLYVADSENHLVRAVDLERGEVITLAGTGAQAGRFNEAGVGREVALSTPWDLALRDDVLIVAMAGFHQLWSIDLETLAAGPALGTGREDISDGPAHRCTLAQPTGVHVADGRIYFADSESSAVRLAEEGRDGLEVRTIVGKGLFDFGDEDGKGSHVRLQHPYGVTEYEGLLYVADTYNNKIKRIDPATGVTEAFLGDGEEGDGDDDALEARFDEPEGVTVADGLLFIADTNNHSIRVTDLREGSPQHRRVTTLEIVG